MTKILLTRHAQTDTAGKILTGRSPGVLLNETGKGQADRLAYSFKGQPVTAIYSSPMERTLETAERIAKELHLQVNILDDLSEIDYGNWTGLDVNELRQIEEFNNYNHFRSFVRIPGGESFAEAQVRMIRSIEKVRTIHGDANIALVSHADPIRTAICWFAGIPLDMMHRIEISPASVSIIEIFKDSSRILLLNRTSEFRL